MLSLPQIYKHHERSPLDKVYKALSNKDLADGVLVAIEVLNETDNYIKFDKEEKSASKAFEHFVVGRGAYRIREYQEAFTRFNEALKLAPVNSEVMQLLYSSRAELLLKTNNFQACVKDVETCLALNCSDSLVNKLRTMKELASVCIAQSANHETSIPFIEQFFTLKDNRNPDIPCATSDVEVIMDSGKPKVVAAKDIPVGTVLAVETSFIRAADMLSTHTSCHYCLKKNFNLIPCEGCCIVMFCDNQCKQKAMQEGHNVECKVTFILLDDNIKLPVKAMFKIRQLCSSWDEFITASKDLGADRMKNSTIAEIFGSDKFSLLNSHYDPHFIYGAMFNRCMYFANIIHYLETQTSFLPSSPDDKNAAIRAVSKVMMHLSLYCVPVQPQLITSVCTENVTTGHHFLSAGYFPFLGNLAHSCLPNSYVMGLWNKAALVTIAPVKKGAELTFSYPGHWLVEKKESAVESRNHMRTILLVLFRKVCKDCVVCDGRAVNANSNSKLLNDTQMKAFTRYYSNIIQMKFPQNMEVIYKETCNTLQALSDVPFSKEYEEVFVNFLKCLIFCTQKKFPNEIMAQPKIV